MADVRNEQRILLIDAALILIHQAAKSGSVLALDHEAKKLVTRFPDSGMTIEEVRAHLARVANDESLAMAFG